MEKIAPRTTTDLGKIILTNGHEYNPETVYEKNTFVLYQNSTYVALQTVTGIEPSNDLVNWQLMAKGFAGDDFVAENFVFVNRGDDESDPAKEPLIDADALGGNKPDFYAPQHEISDAFSTEKDYAIGDYCIYLNSLYRFTTAKSAGAWDGAAVVPVTIAQEMQDFSTRIESINGNLQKIDANDATAVSMFKEKWDSLPTAEHGIGWAYVQPYGGAIVALYYKHALTTYGWAILCSYTLRHPIYIIVNDNIFGNAYYL